MAWLWVHVEYTQTILGVWESLCEHCSLSPWVQLTSLSFLFISPEILTIICQMAKCGVAHGLGVSPLPMSHASTPVGVQWFTQFWRYLPRGSIRSHRLRVQFHKIAHPLQVLVRSPSYHLLTDRSEILVNPSLGSINLLEELTELTEMFH